MNNELKLDLNNSDCIVTKIEFKQTIVYNICSGDITEVPNTALDFMSMLFIGTILSVLCVGFLKVLFER